jgi:WD40 repeat protein/serine/threonine protein kinase
MNPTDADRGDELFSSLLAAYDEALAKGNPSESSAPPSPDVTPRLQRAQEFLARLEREWPRAAPVAAQSAPFAPASGGEKKFGRFQIRKELGRGGCGVVYLAFDPVLRRELALKFPLPAVLISPALRQRFLREARAAAGLDHPYLVAVYEVDEGPICYIASAYCEGPTLAAWLKDHPGPVPPRKAAMLIAAVADGIAHAHERGILHRDLKPSNILLTPVQSQAGAQALRDAVADWELPGAAANGGLEVIPRVTDFGLAKVMEADREENGSGCQTRSGAIIGTPQYMPPEQAEGRHEDIGPTADVYSLGAILYELLTGQVPFTGKTDVEILRRIHSEEAVPPRRLRRDVPRDLETICLKCLEKEPRKRYSEASALGQDLRRFLAKRPIQARRTPAWERALKWTRRHPVVATSCAISAGLLLCLLILSWLLESLGAQYLALLKHQNSEKTDLRIQRQETNYHNLRQRYDQDMHQLQAHWAVHHGDQTLKRLNDYRPREDWDDLRGFVWYYWWKRCQGEYFWLYGHSGKVNAVAIGHQGAVIASGSTDLTVKLWDSVTGELLATLRHGAAVACLDFSPDGKTLASGGDDGSVRLWDVDARRQRAVLEGHEGAVRAVAFSPDGSILVSAGARGALCKWDPLLAKQQAAAHRATGFSSLAFAPDGNALATGGEDGSIVLWEVSGLQARATFPGVGGRVAATAFSPDGKLLASAAAGAVALWDVATGRVYAPVPWEGDARSVAFAPDGKSLVVSGHAGGDPARAGLSKRFRREDRRVIAEFHWNRGPINSSAFAPDGQAIVLGGETGIVNVWRPQAQTEAVLLGSHPDVRSLAFAPDGRLLATAGGGDNAIQLWDAASGRRGTTLRGHSGLVNCIAFSPDGKLLASGSGDHSVRLWDVVRGVEVANWQAHADSVLCLAWSSDSQTLVTGGKDFVVKPWDVATRKVRVALQGHRAPVNSVVFAPDGVSMASASQDGTVRLWDAQLWRPMLVLPGEEVQETWSVAYSPDSKTLASKTLAVGTSDGAIHLWDVPPHLWNVAEWKQRAVLRGHIQGVRALAFSADGISLASGGDDGTVRLWDPVTGQELLTLKHHQQRVVSVAFAPDARTLASAGADGAVYLHRGATDREAGGSKR